ncbi:MAG: SUMF1/EgtB/PvdO family nonheme iron enzyme [Bacteroidales bacterium]
MKNYLLIFQLIFIILLSNNLFGQSKQSKKEQFVRFENNLFVSKFELSNEEYKLFLTDVRKNASNDEITSLLPDSTMWVKSFEYSFNMPYTQLYHWHPSYNDYPVVNLKKEGIESYCNWLTEKYNTDPKREYKKVLFRLPTEAEWMKFSKPLPDHRLPWYGNFAYKMDKNDKPYALANIKVKNYATNSYDFVFDGGLITVKVGKYEPNSLGLFDIIGNVAEYTSDNKIKGGSWDSTLDECFIDKTQEYPITDPRVGFRLVMEIIEK